MITGQDLRSLENLAAEGGLGYLREVALSQRACMELITGFVRRPFLIIDDCHRGVAVMSLRCACNCFEQRKEISASAAGPSISDT